MREPICGTLSLALISAGVACTLAVTTVQRINEGTLMELRTEAALLNEALAGRDIEEQRQLLTLLESSPNVSYAALYDSDRQRIASWTCGEATPPERVPQELCSAGESLDGPQLSFCLPTRDDGRVTGSLLVMGTCSSPLASGLGMVGLWLLFTAAGFLLSRVAGRRVAESRRAQAKNETSELERQALRERALHAEEAVRDARAIAEARAEFVSTVSHEIRNPLGAILGMNSLLLDTQLSADQRNFAETVEESANALLELLNSVLDHSKLEAEQMEYDSTPTELRDLIQSTLQAQSQRADAKGLELSSAIPDDVPAYVDTDPGRLRQVLVNLVGNALKFTEAGEVTVALSRTTDERGAACLRFEVQDTGIGIAPENLERVFESYSQEEASTAHRFGGTGLGLSISQRLIAGLGGAIGVDSELGQGSTFWFTLPLEGAEPVVMHARHLDALRDRRITVVDPHPAARRSLHHILDAWPCELQELEDANGLLAALATASESRQPIDLVVLSIQVYEAGGPELLAALNGDGCALWALGATQTRLSDALRLVEQDEPRAILKPTSRSRVLDALAHLLARPNLAKLTEEPARRPEPQPQASTLGPDPIAAPGEAPILIVDDNDSNIRFLSILLRRLGMQFDVAVGGREAVQACKEHSYRLVLMDLMMPVLDGYAATQEIRAHERGSGIRTTVIALTADVSAEVPERCSAAELDGVLHKPVDRAALMAAIQSALEDAPAAPLPSAPGPAPVAQPTSLQPRTAEPAAPSGAPRILVAEDDPNNQRVMRALLERSGYVVEMVQDGQQALDALHREPYSMALFDVRMPVMDGLEALRRWRALESERGLERLPIVSLTGNALQGDAEACLEAGADDYLAKPIEPSKLTALLREHAPVSSGGVPAPPVASISTSTSTAKRLDPEQARARKAARDALLGAHEPEPQEQAPAGRLLLVDDNPVNRRFMMRLLEKYGYEVEQATDGMEALAALEAATFGAVLMDVQMPNMDGFAATQEWRKRELAASGDDHTPILGVSANTNEDDREKGYEAGMDAYLCKPVRPAELREVLGRMLRNAI